MMNSSYPRKGIANLNKLQIFNDAHIEMKRIMEDLTMDRVLETEETILKYFSFLKQLSNLPEFDKKSKYEDFSNTAETVMDLEDEPINQKDKLILPLDRKLRGGFLIIEDKPDNIFIPEGKIRKYGFEHGDLIQAIPGGDGKFSFEFVKNQPEIRKQSPRKQVDYCIVTKKDSIWVCESYQIQGEEKMIKLDEVPHSFIIPEDDVREFGLEIGSIVDIAYYETHPNRVRVVYVHESQQKEYQAPQPAGFYKKEKAPAATQEQPDLIDFKDKTILVVGLEARKSKFELEIKARGGHMLWASGNEAKSRLEAMVKKADMAVVIIQHTSHRGSIKTAEFCKKHKVKFCSTQSRGLDSLISAITNNLESLQFIS